MLCTLQFHVIKVVSCSSTRPNAQSKPGSQWGALWSLMRGKKDSPSMDDNIQSQKEQYQENPLHRPDVTENVFLDKASKWTNQSIIILELVLAWTSNCVVFAFCWTATILIPTFANLCGSEWHCVLQNISWMLGTMGTWCEKNKFLLCRSSVCPFEQLSFAE